MMYRQVELHRGAQRKVAWIPELFARKGKTVKIREGGSGPWDDGWSVHTVYDGRREEAEVLAHARDYRHQREASDIERGFKRQ